MKTGASICVVLLLCWESYLVSTARSAFAEVPPELAAGLSARDRGDIESLRKLIETAQSEARQKSNAESWQKVAQLDQWLTEAAQLHDDEKSIKGAAQDGLSAAEKAVTLNPASSEAHRLLGDLLGEMIPHTFMGGMRLGKRAASELDKAIQLEPRNANAHVGRAIGYYFTPSAFGGSHQKAADLLKKAQSDSTLAEQVRNAGSYESLPQEQRYRRFFYLKTTLPEGNAAKIGAKRISATREEAADPCGIPGRTACTSSPLTSLATSSPHKPALGLSEDNTLESIECNTSIV